MSIVQPIVRPQTRHPVIYSPIVKYFEDITYQSDFSAGNDSFTHSSVLTTGNIDYGGLVDVLKVDDLTSSTSHRARRASTLTIGQLTRVIFWVNIPSTNAAVNHVAVYAGSGTQQFIQPTPNTWQRVEFIITPLQTDLWICPAPNGSTFNYTGQNDLIYLKDVEVVELQ